MVLTVEAAWQSNLERPRTCSHEVATPPPLSMLSSVNRDHWNERLNFTGGAMILKPFPPVVILIILIFFDSKEWLSKPRIKTQKRKEGTWQIPTAKPWRAYAWSITYTIRLKTKQYCQATFHRDKKNGKIWPEAYAY